MTTLTVTGLGLVLVLAAIAVALAPSMKARQAEKTRRAAEAAGEAVRRRIGARDRDGA